MLAAIRPVTADDLAVDDFMDGDAKQVFGESFQFSPERVPGLWQQRSIDEAVAGDLMKTVLAVGDHALRMLVMVMTGSVPTRSAL